MPHPTHNRSFRRRSSQPVTWLILTNKAVQENKHTETKYEYSKGNKHAKTKYKSDKVNNLKTECEEREERIYLPNWTTTKQQALHNIQSQAAREAYAYQCWPAAAYKKSKTIVVNITKKETFTQYANKVQINNTILKTVIRNVAATGVGDGWGLSP